MRRAAEAVLLLILGILAPIWIENKTILAFAYGILVVAALAWLSTFFVSWRSPLAPRHAPNLDEEGRARRAARRLAVEIATIDGTVSAALECGFWWNVSTTSLPAAEWPAAQDLLGEHAPKAHRAAADVYVRADLLNKAALDHAQGGEDEFGPAVRDSMLELRAAAGTARPLLTGFADGS